MGRGLLLRLGGLLAIAVGLGALYFFLWLPLQEAQAGAAQVSYQLRVFALVPLCLVFGLIFLLFGERFEYRTPDHKNLTAAGWIALAIVAALTAMGWWWFDQQFAALGYV
ncbi:hypothetical protein [Devosia soli]|uniref:hypothetical protein n=1 Tax=Devosia soli TaxID=361041 RepID=UPI000A982763|nr:hypothetical protein [Devosia soli]